MDGLHRSVIGDCPLGGRKKTSTTCVQLSARHIEGSLLGSRVIGAFVPWALVPSVPITVN